MTYTSAVLIKAYLGPLGTGDDALLDELGDRAQKIVETYTQRVFEGTGTSSRKFDAVADVDDRTLFFDEDVVSITSITNRADADSGTEAITSAHYVTIPRNKTPYFGIKLLASANKEWDYQDDPEMGITVVANWRYSVTPPDDVVQATTRLAAFLYRQKDSNADLDRPLLTGDGVTIMPSSLPHDVRQILDPYRKRFVKAA